MRRGVRLYTLLLCAEPCRGPLRRAHAGCHRQGAALHIWLTDGGAARTLRPWPTINNTPADNSCAGPVQAPGQLCARRLLGRGSMFVVSRRQLERLVGDAGPSLWGGVLLDLGAGDGRATSAIASLFSQVYVTEVSVPMRWILARRGYQLVEADEWPYLELRPHVISALNLLDRCDRPLTLLRQLRETLRPGGRALVALVLPYHHYVETGGQADHRPTEWLPIKGETFEEQAASAIVDLFEPAGFHVERWCRLPYLCEGDLNQAFYWLDDALFVLSVSNS
ncbi:protein-L-histidine N-pros-methyltransferase-like [Schistocerca americana]|uniref:protein-L-histidine N-pros-methyltransferase-like n=1 Tax=Schistocerca americana TaxID=7009 RepID=UPI001F501103|nr:protein-L-histidine N-pros-methyltransferase-like [Schistocerca americana]